jgi:hypothetical protein
VVDGPEHYRRVGGVMEADVNCTKCLGYLGWDLYVNLYLIFFTDFFLTHCTTPDDHSFFMFRLKIMKMNPWHPNTQELYFLCKF